MCLTLKLELLGQAKARPQNVTYHVIWPEKNRLHLYLKIHFASFIVSKLKYILTFVHSHSLFSV